MASLGDLPRAYCCDAMRRQLQTSCDAHVDRSECPDCLVGYSAKFDEYGLVIHDGGSSVNIIFYCPWCGVKLPESKRDAWFDQIESLGLDPREDELPKKYLGDEWYALGSD